MEGTDEDKGRPDRHEEDWTQRRNWTQRFAGPVQFQRFTALNTGGEARIMFSFTLPDDQDRVDDAIYAIMSEHKKHPNGSLTGLRYTHDRIHGKTWNLADTPDGRYVAECIDRRLNALAKKLEHDEGVSR